MKDSGSSNSCQKSSTEGENGEEESSSSSSSSTSEQKQDTKDGYSNSSSSTVTSITNSSSSISKKSAPLKKRQHSLSYELGIASESSSSAGDGNDGGNSISPPQKKKAKSGDTSTSSSSSTSSDEADNSGSSSDSSKGTEKGSKKKKKKTRKDGLRKGKWTPEEEAYTTAIIRHFRAGLLRLPEGSTLRGYLADKLNCDPMRITKKYAGAACLGKRTFSFCDRLSIGDIETAQQQLDILEKRFNLRLETGHSAIPIPETLANESITSSSHSVSSVNFPSTSNVASAPSYMTSLPQNRHNHLAPLLNPLQQPQQQQQQQQQPATSAFIGSNSSHRAGLGLLQQQQHHQQQQALLALLPSLNPPQPVVAPTAPAPAPASDPSHNNLQGLISAALLPLLAAQQPYPAAAAASASSNLQSQLATLLSSTTGLAQPQPAQPPLPQPHHSQPAQQPSYQTPLALAQNQAQSLASLPPNVLSQALLSALQKNQPSAQSQTAPSLAGSQPVSLPNHHQEIVPPHIPPSAVPSNDIRAAAASSAHRVSPIPAEAASIANVVGPAKAEEKTSHPMPTGSKTAEPSSDSITDEKAQSSRSNSPRTKADEEAGSALFGFLSALRKGHEEALAKAAIEDKAVASLKSNGDNDDTEEAKASCSSNSSAAGTTDTSKTAKSVAIEESAKTGTKRSTFRTVSSLTDQNSSDVSAVSGSASASKESSSSDGPQAQEGSHTVNIKQIGPSYSLPKQCSDISAGIGEADIQEVQEVQGKEIESNNGPFCTSSSLAPPASVTDCSSGVKTDSTGGSTQNDSSVGEKMSSEDTSSHGDRSDASNKMDSTSSEDDDDKNSKEDTKVAARRKAHAAHCDEPETKRQKKVEISDFTSKNVAAHNRLYMKQSPK